MILLSHGQASVERGFSINREVEEDNLLERSITAKRMICDHVSSVGGISNVVVDSALLASAASACQSYMLHLDEQKKTQEETAAS